MNAPPEPMNNLSIAMLLDNADPIVKAIMVLLVMASFLCWAIGIEKLMRYAAFSAQLRGLERALAAWKKDGGMGSWLSQLFQTISASEPRDATETAESLQAHIERSLQWEAANQIRRLRSGLPLLATVGSTAPFIGLFGTVWGIMTSFTGIAVAKDTSLAVVAPGIAEALLATAAGLAAAIPAVVMYNLATVYLSNCSDRLNLAASQYAKIEAYGAACLKSGRRVDGTPGHDALNAQ